LSEACPDVWLRLPAGGKGSHFADTVAGALELPLLVVVREEPSLAADLLHGMPPGSSAKGALAAAADAVLARCVVGAAGPRVSVSPASGPRSGANGAPRLGWVRRFSICGGRGDHARSPLASHRCMQGRLMVAAAADV
jgi:hypothetical protein